MVKRIALGQVSLRVLRLRLAFHDSSSVPCSSFTSLTYAIGSNSQHIITSVFIWGCTSGVAHGWTQSKEVGVIEHLLVLCVKHIPVNFMYPLE